MEHELERLALYRQKNPNGLVPEEFDKIEREIRNPDDGTISDELLDFNLWCGGLPSRQEAFSRYVGGLLPAGEAQNILEVGGGRNAGLSRRLAKMGHRMTCMDPKLATANGDKREANIRLIPQQFDWQDISLSGYDWVVAQEPCDATEHIIRACLAQNVPFVVALCGAPHRLISGEMPENVWRWYEYLQNIDRERIKFELLELYQLVGVAVIRSR